MTSRLVRRTAASAITIRPVHWLWQERLARGAFALLGGREGIGKSLVAVDCAARVTRGELPGDALGTPQDVLIVAAEDPWEYVLVPRLIAAGADLTRVHRIDVDEDGHLASLVVPHDLDGLRAAITETQAALVILDPLVSRLAAGLDSHKDAEVRRALEPLAALAADRHAAVLGLLHVNKSQSADPLSSLMGSRAFTAVARTVLYVVVDPYDETTRLFGLVKSNLGRGDLPTQKFDIIGTTVPDPTGAPVTTGRIRWQGTSPVSIGAALTVALATPLDRTATSDAAEWLADYLSSSGGRADSATIKAVGKAAGHSADALKRARTKLGISATSAGFPRKTTWTLPSERTADAIPKIAPTTLTTLTALTERQSEQPAQSVQSWDTADGLPRLRCTCHEVPAGDRPCGYCDGPDRGAA